MTNFERAWFPSPNFGERRGNVKPEFIIIHYTAIGLKETFDRFLSPSFEVSSHYVISQQGEIIQLVCEKDRAWHAGHGSWCGLSDLNSKSIGIELVNPGNCPYALKQISALVALLKEIQTRWNIPNHNILGHADIACNRKIDPGPKFDWRLLALEGLGFWPFTIKECSINWSKFIQHLTKFGYTKPSGFDEETWKMTLLKVFRDRFRPHHQGVLDPIDMGIAKFLTESIAGWNSGTPH